METRYFMGVDWGVSPDRTHFAVIDSEGTNLLTFVVNNDSFAQVRSNLVQLYTQFNPVVILVEANYMGMATTEALQQEGLPIQTFRVTKNNKQALFDGLRQAIAEGRVTTIDSVTIAAALAEYARKYHGGGTIIFV